jgi:hypothetical protein
MCKDCQALDAKLIRAWFREYYNDPDYFLFCMSFVNSPELRFVAEMVSAFVDD